MAESIKPKRTYVRICSTCGATKEVHYNPKKDTQCRSCASKISGYNMSQNNRKADDDKKRYKHTCTDCGEIRYLLADPASRKTTLCGLCSRKATGKANTKEKKVLYEHICTNCGKIRHLRAKSESRITTFCGVCSRKTTPTPKDMTPKLFVRVCITEGCDDIKMVSSAKNAEGKMCQSCRSKKPKKNKTNYPKNRKSTKAPVSQHAIDMQIEKNRAYKEEVKAEKERLKAIIPTQKISDEDMVANFLNDNKPSVELEDIVEPKCSYTC